MYKEALEKVMEKNPELEAVLLAASDGLPIEVVSRDGREDSEEMAARIMALVSSALSYEIQPINYMSVKAGERSIFVVPVGEDVFLIALGRGGYEGKIKFYLQMAASEIEL